MEDIECLDISQQPAGATWESFWSAGQLSGDTRQLTGLIYLGFIWREKTSASMEHCCLNSLTFSL